MNQSDNQSSITDSLNHLVSQLANHLVGQSVTSPKGNKASVGQQVS